MKIAIAVALVAALALPTAAASRADAAPTPIVGSWWRTVTTADTVRRGRVATGPWRLEVTRAGVMRLFNSSSRRAVVTGKVAAGPSGTLKMLELVVTGGGRCRDEATYRWRLAAGRLTLTTAQDKCPGRPAVLVGTWRRSV